MATLSVDGLEALLGELGVDGAIPAFPQADVQNNPMGIYLSYLAEILVQLTECESQVAYDSLQWPNDIGDLVAVLPRLRLRDVDHDGLATELRQKFPASPLFANPIDDGIHLRVIFRSLVLARLLIPYIIDRGLSYGTDTSSGQKEDAVAEGEKKKIVVEFSSPNLGKQFDGNHLRSTIIGAYIASVYQTMGWDVCRMNFLGDWGRHIGLLAVGWFRFGSEELFEVEPLKHLLDVFTQINELYEAERDEAKKRRADGQGDPTDESHEVIWAEKDAFFKKMEDGEPDALALWKKFRDACVTSYADLLARLNLQFDDYSGESEVSHDTIAEVETVLKAREVYKESDGAWVIDFEKHGSKGLRTTLARYSNGTTSYLLRDIAAVLERSRKYSFDKMIYVVTAKQDSHFHELSAALELMGHSELAHKIQHVPFGKTQGLLPQADSRGLLLGDILDQCQTVIHHAAEEHPDDFQELRDEHPSALPEGLGGVALMVQALSVKRGSTFVFDASKMADVAGYTGLNLQHWYGKLDTRLQNVSIERDDLTSADFSPFEDEESLGDVLRLLIQFPAVVKTSFKNLESSTLVTYLFRLTDLLSVAWEDGEEGEGEEREEVENEEEGAEGEEVDNEEEGAEGVEDDKHVRSSTRNIAKLAFLECVRQVLGNGMRMLGLEPMKRSLIPTFSELALDEPVLDELVLDTPALSIPAVDEAPVDEAPVHEAPVHEAPVHEAAVDQSKADEQALEESTIKEPANDAPTDDAPADDAPADDAPADDAPADDAPADDAPADDAPADDAPADDAPADDDPADDDPADDDPAVDDPAGAEPAVDAQVSEKPVLDEPASEDPDLGEPAPKNSVPDEPGLDETASKESLEQPVLEKPECLIDAPVSKE